ncbi:MAG: type II toxin-antitoxin system VapC family toxin [Deltaproteobacteria bacterium]|nr:type II toxin-antitoxin system VapC family toxin [Deltaproteobacteria bacterium]MBW1737605.1 type II toxin-antitoxin system VapC family toxin [Deltaproteobacteria bacterium]MBW1910071.1 type II toxin-antitoxin system VapC family toxin [Deltaproteobacteria bacterium]MBW2032957.1 type II toxin-antitoxin system VapC family toxin [Deltaproteobacteria bacterium]MBW2114894.1 type II toxin-antitoxin system VapC family toxin [Deltaproteobacteria bacterium]
MIFDTDIFIWVQMGNGKAARLIDKSENRYLSIQTYMELLQSAKNKTQHKYVKDFIASYDFMVLPFTENIGHRASIYIEEYTLSSSLRSGDAIIAATAVENNMTLVSSNTKYFKEIKDLKLKAFRP